MFDLQEKSGLPLFLDGTKLVFGDGLPVVEADVRTVAQMEPVLKNKIELSSDMGTYFMYRNVGFEGDKEKICSAQLRYDITVIPPLLLGSEFNKTFGHFHPKNSAGAFFPEVYEVIQGVALYLLQSVDGSTFFAVRAREGEKVLMPPGFGHVTVNAGKKVLVMSNWVEKNFSSNYGPMREMRGAMHYFTVNGFEKNLNYARVPKVIEISAPSLKNLGLVQNKSLYVQGVKNLSALGWLVEPEKFLSSLHFF
jgi:glucose-6-phosphate isomerase, archaeal